MDIKTLSYAEEQYENAKQMKEQEKESLQMQCKDSPHLLSKFKNGDLDAVNILGTTYIISVKSIEEDDSLKKCWGYCDCTSKEIIITCLDDAMKLESIGTRPKEILRKTLRHEIVHAFLWESGLYSSTNNFEQWACNEEMIDWIAMQGVKIMRAWVEVDAI